MITSDDILSLNFYNYGNPFTGSYQGMRYRNQSNKKKQKDERGQYPEGGRAFGSNLARAFAYEKTQDALRQHSFSF